MTPATERTAAAGAGQGAGSSLVEKTDLMPRCIALITGLAVALLLPLLFFAVGYQIEAVRLETAVRLYARLASRELQEAQARKSESRLPASAPDTIARLEALAALDAPLGLRILDGTERVLLDTGGNEETALLTRGAAAARPDNSLWRVEASLPVRPLLFSTGLAVPFGMVLGWLVFRALRALPTGALQLALKEIAARRGIQAHLEQSLSVFAATLESTADGIFVADSTGRAVVSNQRFLEMWNIPGATPFWQSDHEPLAALAAQLRDPTSFFRKQRELNADADQVSYEVLELADGRVFEWHSQPQRIHGKAVGRVSSFRDISERKRAEVLLVAEKEVLELVVTGAPLRDALSVLARYVETQSRHMFCSILFCENDGDGYLLCATGPSLPDSVAHSLSLRLPVSLLEAGAPDMDSRAWADYRRILAEWGVEPCLAVPIQSSAVQPLGFMVAHYRSAAQRQSYDQELIQVATKLTSIAIERRRAERRLHVLAHYDALTGLPNRVLFRDRLELALVRAQRSRGQVAAMFLDLDRFKTINDTLGHDAGDALLREVATRLKHCVRAQDTVARLGGDEFTVILEQVGRNEDAAAIARKVIEALAPPFVLAGQETFVATSIGIAFYPADGANLEDLLKNADTAMYKAKEGGGNRYQFYTPEMNAGVAGRLKMESGLRRALERDELRVYYQPKLDLGSGRIVGAEALLRWQSPDGGLVPPGEFIPILEETGLIEPVGEWVLRVACTQVRRWQAAGLPALRLAVNLSAYQFQRSNLAATVARILEETGLAPELLDLEVTESMLMRNPDHAAGIMRELKEQGVHIDVDDFGTGYSSLGYLKRFPIDALKIDKSFVHDLPHSEDDVAITLAVIALAHSLKLKVVAEGVENAQQLAFLRRHGCDEVQGYLIGRPLPAEAFVQFLQERDPEAQRASA